MTVETGVQYLKDLDEDLPAEGEIGTLHEGNDHIRNIKAALIGQFPGMIAEEADVGVNATAAELNILYDTDMTAARLNELAAVTADSDELNILDGATITVEELNFLDGVTSAIQTQLDAAAVFSIVFAIDYPDNGSWVILPKALFGFAITSITHMCSSGTVTAKLYNGGTQVGSDLSVTSSLTTVAISPEVSVAAAAQLLVTFSAASSIEKVVLQIDCERA